MTELDRSAATVLDMIRLSGAPPTETMTPIDARTAYTRTRKALNPDAPAIVEVRDLEATGPHGPIPMRLYRDGADAEPRAGFVFFHGGGWVIGDLDSHDVVCRQIAQRSRAVVIAVDYRMGPEYRFPTAVDDAIAATGWIAENAMELGVDPHRIAVGGDSAGGNLAAVVAIDARDRGGPSIALQVLIYPATDFSMTHASHALFSEGYALTNGLMDYFQGHYLSSEIDKSDWRASPMLADSLADLPPALVITAGFDPLRDEGEAYARSLIEAGVPVTIRRFPGQIHGFITMGRVIPEAGQAIGEIAAAMAARGL